MTQLGIISALISLQEKRNIAKVPPGEGGEEERDCFVLCCGKGKLSVCFSVLGIFDGCACSDLQSFSLCMNE